MASEGSEVKLSSKGINKRTISDPLNIFKKVLNAWQVLQDKMSRIQAILHESRYRAEKLNPPVNRVPSKKLV